MYIASFDFGLLCGGKPVEAQVFDCWYMAIYFPKEEVAPKIFKLLPGIREARSREKQIELGRQLLTWVRSRPDFVMPYSTASMSDDYHTAVHEAGHVVMAHRLGVIIWCASIVVVHDEDTQGRTVDESSAGIAFQMVNSPASFFGAVAFCNFT